VKIEMEIKCPKCGSLNLKNDFEDIMNGICLDCGYIDLANKFITKSNKEDV
jgi:predicted nucleic-acid-binding Zn-ribbon protein